MRVATHDDVCAIHQLISSLTTYFVVDEQHPELERFLASISQQAIADYVDDPQFHYVIAQDLNGQLVGVIAIKKLTHLYHFFVRSDHHRQGLGRRMWQYARDYWCLHRVTKVTVNSTLYAVPVYEALGFVAIDSPIERMGIAYVPMHCDLML